MNKLKTLTIQFETQLLQTDIQRFRGAIIKLLPKKNVLFHNHTKEGGYRYAYPLIQYKRLNNKAALFCIGEGVENIGVLFASNNFNVRIGNKRHCLQIEEVNAKQVDIACEEGQVFAYQLTDWLPLNEENHAAFAQADDEQRLQMLQRILTGNILSMLKGVGIRVEQRIEVCITSIKERACVPFKGVKLYCANVGFVSNVRLPQHVGLGKHASVGFGILTATNND